MIFINISKSIRNSIREPVHWSGIYERELFSFKNHTQRFEELITFVGLTNDADVSSLNLATVLHDKDVLTIPTKTSEKQINLISINTADLNALLQIPKIGEKNCASNYRLSHQYGLFHSLEELMKVKGIGQAKFDFIKDKICL